METGLDLHTHSHSCLIVFTFYFCEKCILFKSMKLHSEKDCCLRPMKRNRCPIKRDFICGADKDVESL